MIAHQMTGGEPVGRVNHESDAGGDVLERRFHVRKPGGIESAGESGPESTPGGEMLSRDPGRVLTKESPIVGRAVQIVVRSTGGEERKGGTNQLIHAIEGRVGPDMGPRIAKCSVTARRKVSTASEHTASSEVSIDAVDARTGGVGEDGSLVSLRKVSKRLSIDGNPNVRLATAGGSKPSNPVLAQRVNRRFLRRRSWATHRRRRGRRRDTSRRGRWR